jgi:hypothetical protein
MNHKMRCTVVLVPLLALVFSGRAFALGLGGYMCAARGRADTGSPGSHTRCFRTCTGSRTARGSAASRDIDASDIAFHLSLQCRRPGVACFRSSIPSPHEPLPTLRRRPPRRLRMTRGRRGSLLFQRKTLAFATPRRFLPAHKDARMEQIPLKGDPTTHPSTASRASSFERHVTGRSSRLHIGFSSHL